MASQFAAVLRPSPFFFRLASNAFPDIGSVGLKKKKTSKQHHKKSRNRRPWYPGTTLNGIHIIGFTKCTICCKKCSCFSLCCYYDHFSDRLKELFRVKNGLTTSLLFFFENAKNLGRSDDAKRRKKRGWPNKQRNFTNNQASCSRNTRRRWRNSVWKF